MKKQVLALILGIISLSFLFSFCIPASEAGLYDDEETIKQVQEALNEAGYDCGTPDGVAGDKTHSAIERYKTDNNLSETSSDITTELLIELGIREMPVVVTDGFYREVADNIDPKIELSATSDALYINRDYSEEEDKAVN